MIAPETHLRLRQTWRIIPSRYPSAGILDAIANPEDLDAIIELESWTNDRISAELGLLYRLPREEWLTGRPMATVVMAAFCHPRPGGGRFNSGERGAWYASYALETAHAEVVFHRSQELAEVGVLDTFVQVRAYQACFRTTFHDLRERTGAIYSPSSYKASQSLAARLLDAGSNGVIYCSVRHAGGVCIACFRPRLVLNLRQGAHYEYRWTGRRVPRVKRIG